MPRLRLIQPHVILPRYRMIRMPVVAAEFAPHIDVEINDENVEKLDLSPADLVGLTCQSYNANRAFYISRQFRKQGIKTILGGVFATAMPDMALEHFDSVVSGEVEGLGEQIVSDFNKGALKKVYRNETPPDLTDTSMPRLDLLKNSRYYNVTFPIESSRGCPHECSFCFCRYQYPKYRTRSMKDIDRDLKQYDFGVVELLDHHFAASKRHLFDVCDVMRSNNVVSFMGEATIMSLGDAEVVRKLSDSGCRMIFVGLETVSNNALSGVNKSFNDLDEYRRIIRMCQDYGIFIHTGLMWGLNGQDETVYDETYRFLADTRTYITGSNLLVYYPGTQVYREAKEQGRIISEDLRDYDCEHITVLPENFDAKTLLKGIKRFHNRFYSVWSIFRRSFQATNRNLAMLWDYWGFNWAYRVYYKSWVRRVSKNLKDLIKHQEAGTNPPVRQNPGELNEKNSLPLNYGKVPLTYTLLALNWKYWEFWIRLYLRPRGKPKLLFTVFSLAVYAAAALLAYGRIEISPAVTAAMPPAVKTILLYLVLWTGSEFAVFSVTKRIRSGAVSALAGLLLSAPLLYLPFAADNLVLRLVLAAANTVFLLKNLAFSGSPEKKTSGFYRYHAFMALYPAFDFTGAYKLDLLRSTFGKAFGLFLAGAIQAALAFAAFAGIVVIHVNFPEAFDLLTAPYMAVVILKGLYVYFALAGFMNIVVSQWVVWGYKADSTFNSPLLSSSVSNFWKRFNTAYYRFCLHNIYAPVMRRSGQHRKLALPAATLLPFLLSAVLCSYTLAGVLIYDNPLVYLRYVFAFFGIQWVITTLQGWIGPRRRTPLFLRISGILPTLLLIIASSVLFFIATDKVFMTIIER